MHSFPLLLVRIASEDIAATSQVQADMPWAGPSKILEAASNTGARVVDA